MSLYQPSSAGINCGKYVFFATVVRGRQGHRFAHPRGEACSREFGGTGDPACKRTAATPNRPIGRSDSTRPWHVESRRCFAAGVRKNIEPAPEDGDKSLGLGHLWPLLASLPKAMFSGAHSAVLRPGSAQRSRTRPAVSGPRVGTTVMALEHRKSTDGHESHRCAPKAIA